MDVFIKTEIHHQKIKLLYSAATHVGLGVIQRIKIQTPTTPPHCCGSADHRRCVRNVVPSVCACPPRAAVHRQGSGCQVVRLMRCGGVKTRSRESGLGTWEERQFLEATVTVVTVSADLCRFHGSQRLTSANCRHLGSTAAAAVSSCSVYVTVHLSALVQINCASIRYAACIVYSQPLEIKRKIFSFDGQNFVPCCPV